MELMPEEVLLHIFSHVDHESLCMGVRPVCTRWRQLSFDPWLWKHVAIPEQYSEARMQLFLSQVHRSVERLDLQKCKYISLDALDGIALPSLKKLNLSYNRTLTEACVSTISKCCPRLEFLDKGPLDTSEFKLIYSRGYLPNLKTILDEPQHTWGQHKYRRWMESMQEASSSCPNVVNYRCIYGRGYLNKDGLPALSALFPRLVSVRLLGSDADDDSLKKFLTFNQAEGGLRQIDLHNPRKLTDKGLKTIATHCPNLRSLTLHGCSYITSHGVHQLMQHCSHLEKLVLASFDEYQFNDDDLNVISKQERKLTSIEFKHTKDISFEGLSLVVSRCKWLQTVRADSLQNFDDKSLNALLECAFLKTLDLRHCGNVTELAMLEFVSRAPSLNDLIFYIKRPEINSDYDHSALSALCHPEKPKTSQVRDLYLSNTTGQFLVRLTALCPEINYLMFYSSTEVPISEDDVMAVFNNCPLLENANIFELPFDVGERFLATVCHHKCLRSLTLGNLSARHFTVQGLAEITKTCPSLSKMSLEISPEDNLDPKELADLIRKHHGGHCQLWQEELGDCFDTDDGEEKEYVDYNFTPTKYL